jgi:hypothetical protein
MTAGCEGFLYAMEDAVRHPAGFLDDKVRVVTEKATVLQSGSSGVADD